MNAADNPIEEITISIFRRSDGEYEYNIYDGSPEEVADGKECEDGGVCISTIGNAIDMACKQAKDLIAKARRNSLKAVRHKDERNDHKGIER